MTRIFLSLASLSLFLLIVALVVGLLTGDLYAQPTPDRDTLHWATIHRLTGVAAGLAVIFVECIVVTYFIGTSRWCKEVVETYQLDPAAVIESNYLKRQTFPWALAGMLAVVGMIALGGAADPGAMFGLGAKDWSQWHLLGTILGIFLIAWTYLISWNNIVANHAIIQRVVGDVARIRRTRGLNTETSKAENQSDN